MSVFNSKKIKITFLQAKIHQIPQKAMHIPSKKTAMPPTIPPNFHKNPPTIPILLTPTVQNNQLISVFVKCKHPL